MNEELSPNRAAAAITSEVAKVLGVATLRLRRLLKRPVVTPFERDSIEHDVERVDAAWAAFTPSLSASAPLLPRQSTPTERMLNAEMASVLAPSDPKTALALLHNMFLLLTNPMVQAEPGKEDITVSIHFRKTDYNATVQAIAKVLRASGYSIP